MMILSKKDKKDEMVFFDEREFTCFRFWGIIHIERTFERLAFLNHFFEVKEYLIWILSQRLTDCQIIYMPLTFLRIG